MNGFDLNGPYQLFISYPLIPWIGVMSLGYVFGGLYNRDVDPKKRREFLIKLGIGAIVLFLLLRLTNAYGDLYKWQRYDTISQTIISFLGANKYPPSLLYLLMTLGPSFLFLAYTESVKGKTISFLKTFGRVPFFYYILHLYLIHLLAGITGLLTGFGTALFVLPEWITDMEFPGYGFNLWGVYVIWILVVFSLYPLCRWFDRYKQANKDKAWLSYF
jgi:uncharacterized membrane protein